MIGCRNRPMTEYTIDEIARQLPIRAVGYIRVSTEEQAESGAGLVVQQQTIEQEVARRGWRLIGIEADRGLSGKSVDSRPGLNKALGLVASGAADAIVVSKLDRLSRSLLDFANLMERANREGWNLVALDLGIDLSTPAGEFLASVMASAAQWERRIIGQRTREALAAKKAQGVRLGRASSLPLSTVQRIQRERTEGATLTAIASELNTEQVPTSQGGRQWYPSTIAAVLKSLPDRASECADED